MIKIHWKCFVFFSSLKCAFLLSVSELDGIYFTIWITFIGRFREKGWLFCLLEWFVAVIIIFHSNSTTISLTNNKLLLNSIINYTIFSTLSNFCIFGFLALLIWMCTRASEWARHQCELHLKQLCKSIWESLRWPLNCIVCRIKCAINFNLHWFRCECLNNKNVPCWPGLKFLPLVLAPQDFIWIRENNSSPMDVDKKCATSLYQLFLRNTFTG